MKALIVLILILLAAGYFFLRMDSSSPERDGNPVRTEQNSGEKGVIEQTAEDVGSFADYATGVTPLKVKQHSRSKIDKLQEEQNKRLRDALE